MPKAGMAYPALAVTPKGTCVFGASYSGPEAPLYPGEGQGTDVSLPFPAPGETACGRATTASLSVSSHCRMDVGWLHSAWLFHHIIS
jgi:hypothetical protein